MKTFGEQLHEARKACGMTQDQLAEEMNITRQAVSNWERNLSAPDEAALERLSQLLNYSFDFSDAPAQEPAPVQPAPTAVQSAAKVRRPSTLRTAVLSFVAGVLVMLLVMQFILPLFNGSKDPTAGMIPYSAEWFRAQRSYSDKHALVQIDYSQNPCLGMLLSTCALGEGDVNQDINHLYMALNYLQAGSESMALKSLQKMTSYDDLVRLVLAAEGIDAGEKPETEVPEGPAPVPEASHSFEGNTDDLLMIEGVEISPMTVGFMDDAQFFQWRVKVRNNTGEDLVAKESAMRIWYRYLDENYDTLSKSYLHGGYSSTVQAGRAEWLSSNGVPSEFTSQADMDQVVYLEIYGYTASLNGLPDHMYAEPICINVREAAQ